MKKTVAFFLALLAILPVSVFASELDFYAAYAHVEMLENDKDAPVFSMIYFTEDNRCYYCEQQFSSTSPEESIAMVGTWEYSGDEDLVVHLGRENLSFSLHFLKDGGLISPDTMHIFYRVNAIWVSR